MMQPRKPVMSLIRRLTDVDRNLPGSLDLVFGMISIKCS